MIVDWADCDAKQWDCKPAKMIEKIFSRPLGSYPDWDLQPNKLQKF
ncbi:hypothetical protein AMA1_62 [Achromobacter phage AMA1]|nr:hypothetical protein AMA1_62 [Achromobacter phage AMA1]